MRKIFLISLILLSSCFSPQPVRVRGSRGEGWGVPISNTRVLTVEHVAGSSCSPLVLTNSGWKHSRILKTLPGNPEPIVILEVGGGLPPAYSLGDFEAGASGSPVLVNGVVVGLVSGWGGGSIIAVPLSDFGE